MAVLGEVVTSAGGLVSALVGFGGAQILSSLIQVALQHGERLQGVLV